MKSIFKKNGLVIVFGIMFTLSLPLQTYMGWKEYNQELSEHQQKIDFVSYWGSGHFIQSTFENWESEFLQMALFVILTIFLRQKGSSESKGFDGPEPVDREPRKKKDAPWPVHKGGLVLQLYKHSLSLCLTIFFILSFMLHWYGSLKYYNTEQLLKGEETVDAFTYLNHSRFWFESFQNWQSEFLSIVAIVVLSIYLRQKGSPQSKPVDAPNYETEA
jgi:hypothetical protein